MSAKQRSILHCEQALMPATFDYCSCHRSGWYAEWGLLESKSNLRVGGGRVGESTISCDCAWSRSIPIKSLHLPTYRPNITKSLWRLTLFFLQSDSKLPWFWATICSYHGRFSPDSSQERSGILPCLSCKESTVFEPCMKARFSNNRLVLCLL